MELKTEGSGSNPRVPILSLCELGDVPYLLFFIVLKWDDNI